MGGDRLAAAGGFVRVFGFAGGFEFVDLVAQGGGFLKLQVLGGQLHLAGELLNEAVAVFARDGLGRDGTDVGGFGLFFGLHALG